MSGIRLGSYFDSTKTPLALLIFCLSTGIVLWRFAGSALVDDAYIYLSYARTLAFHGQWGLVPGLESNTATSALWVLVLSAVSFVIREPLTALGSLYVVNVVAMGWGLDRLGRACNLASAFPWITTAVILLNPIWLSSTGLEVQLGITLIVWLSYAAVAADPRLFGLLSGFVFLCRPDFVIYAGALVIAVEPIRRHAIRAFLWSLPVALPWLLFSWIALGSFVPDTLLIKKLQRSWGEFDYSNGLVLLTQRFPFAIPASLFAPITGLLAVAVLALFRRTSRPISRMDVYFGLVLGGCGYFLVYSFLGVPPYHWYYASVIGVLSIVFCASAFSVDVPQNRGKLAGGVPMLIVSIPAFLGLAVLVGQPFGERLMSMPVTTNWASSEEYQTIGRDLSRLSPDKIISSPGEIGALAYYCDCDIVDEFSDRGILVGRMKELVAHLSPFTRQLWRLNFMHLAYETPPLEPSHRLEWHSGAPPLKTELPGNVIAVWPSYTRWTGDGHFVLRTTGR